jgi:hypothetical protein
MCSQQKVAKAGYLIKGQFVQSFLAPFPSIWDSCNSLCISEVVITWRKSLVIWRLPYIQEYPSVEGCYAYSLRVGGSDAYV